MSRSPVRHVLLWLSLPVAFVSVAACSGHDESTPDFRTTGSLAQAASTNGAGSEIPAYYDHMLFTIQFVEFSSTNLTASFS